MKRAIPALIMIALLGILCWMFPPFHVRSLKEVREAQANQQFNAADFASRFWTEKLLPAADNAADATRVLDAIAMDPKSVRDEFGRTVGVGSSYYLFVRGQGHVVSADENSIELSLKPDSDVAEMVIELGFVFGNAVRDATGLILPSDYPNAQEFNDISAALNSLVETNVLPQLEQTATVGSRFQFVGCIEVGDEDLDLTPLKLVPILVKPD
jgi:predicted lipoprotein